MEPPRPGQTYCVFEGTFPTDPHWIGDDPDPDHPAGREVIELLLNAVDPTLPASDIWNEESFGWAFNATVEAMTVNVLIQNPGHWLIMVQPVGGLLGFLKAKSQAAAVTEASRRVHSGLTATGRVTRIRWFTEPEYDGLAASEAFF